MTGIKELKELLDFGFDMVDAIEKSLDDNKISLSDLPKFIPALTTSGKAFGGLQLVGAEIKDLDDDEMAELMAFARQRFDLPDDSLEFLIEDTLETVIQLYKLGLRWGSRRKAA